jgi:pyruvate kinase
VLAEGVEVKYAALAAFGRKVVAASGVGERGASVIITAGFPFNESGSTNNMRVDQL